MNGHKIFFNYLISTISNKKYIDMFLLLYFDWELFIFQDQVSGEKSTHILSCHLSMFGNSYWVSDMYYTLKKVLKGICRFKAYKHVNAIFGLVAIQNWNLYRTYFSGPDKEHKMRIACLLKLWRPTLATMLVVQSIGTCTPTCLATALSLVSVSFEKIVIFITGFVILGTFMK